MTDLDRELRVETLWLAWRAYTEEVFSEFAEMMYPDDPEGRAGYMREVKERVGNRH